MQRTLSPQQEIIRSRLPWVVFGLVFLSSFLLYQLANFQLLPPDVARELEQRGAANSGSIRRIPAERGIIYDRGGQPLAFNALEYGIGISPNLVADPQGLATQLGIILQRDNFDIFQLIDSDQQWVLVQRPVDAELGQQIVALDDIAITVDPIPRRFYPQGALAGQIIGFTIEEDDNLQGVMGVEGQYNDQLAGRVLNQEISDVPFDLPEDAPTGQEGKDIVLTIDRDIQFWVETELLLAVEESGSTGGTIIVMDPNNGDILAMASYPPFDPNNFENVENPDLLRNPAISETYEPGSVIKVITVAGALEDGVIDPSWTYNDTGVLEIGGIRIENSDRLANGVVDVTQVLVKSLNVGAATISQTMGPDSFYSTLRAFGFGSNTNIDLFGEDSGSLKVPGDDWSESDLGTNSFGQGMSATPLQVITAFSSIANGGLMRQPRIVSQIVDGEEVINAQPASLGRPISAETARIVTEMMVRTVEEGIPAASVPGYTVAGKTGTAEIPSPIGYESGPNSSIVTFVGFLPADDPQVVVLIKLDRPDGYWGSVVAAPVFRRLATRLVNLLEIPNDEIRRQLTAEGGVVNTDR